MLKQEVITNMDKYFDKNLNYLNLKEHLKLFSF